MDVFRIRQQRALKQVNQENESLEPYEKKLHRDRKEYQRLIETEEPAIEIGHSLYSKKRQDSFNGQKKDVNLSRETWELKKYPKTKEEQDEIADALMKWTLKRFPDEVPNRLDMFAIENRMNMTWLYQIAHVNNYFRDILEFCGKVVSQRVLDDWQYQKICKDYARYFLFQNDRTFADIHQKLQQLKNEDTKRTGNITVIMERSPECPDVPTRKVPNE